MDNGSIIAALMVAGFLLIGGVGIALVLWLHYSVLPSWRDRRNQHINKEVKDEKEG